MDPVLFERRGRLGVAVLNRPRAVNALNADMVATLLEGLARWAVDESVATVLLRGAGDRGLCAGGDIVAIHGDLASGGHATAAFWRAEYKLDSLVAHYPKPFVALMDGLVLGGGVGVSAHARLRVVTERTRTGMPETSIGFVPDVGGLFLLSRSPGQSGTHAALTGAHLGAGDAVFLGLADHYVESSSLGDLELALETEPAETAVRRYAAAPPSSPLAAARDWIDTAYAGDDAEAIVGRLRESGGEASKAADTIESKSPTAVKTTLEALRRAAGLATLEECLDQDFRVGVRMLSTPDFAEGIRAQVIDKDRTPRWRPATLADVSRSDVVARFAPLAAHEQGGELGLSDRVHAARDHTAKENAV